jgi:hypothetical protein
MPLFSKLPRRSVSDLGAAAGSVLRGVGMNNQGLRIRVLKGQPRGHGGAVGGRFLLLDTGDNLHSRVLDPLAGRETDAAEVLGLVRQGHPGCVCPANANILEVEVT